MESLIENLVDKLLGDFARAYGLDVAAILAIGGNAVTLTQGLKKKWGWTGPIVPILCGILCLLLSALTWVMVNVAKAPGQADFLHIGLVTVCSIVWGIATGRWKTIMPDNRPPQESVMPGPDGGAEEGVSDDHTR